MHVFSKCAHVKHSKQQITRNTFRLIDQRIEKITISIAEHQAKTHRECQPERKEYKKLTVNVKDFQWKNKVHFSVVKGKRKVGKT